MKNYTVRDSTHPEFRKCTIIILKLKSINLQYLSLLNGITKMMSCDLAAVGIILFLYNNGIHLLNSYSSTFKKMKTWLSYCTCMLNILSFVCQHFCRHSEKLALPILAILHVILVLAHVLQWTLHITWQLMHESWENTSWFESVSYALMKHSSYKELLLSLFLVLFVNLHILR